MEIHVADMRKLPLAEEYERILSHLPEEAIKRAQRFRRQDDRVRSVVAAFMMKRDVERILRERNLPPHFRILRGVYGKPYVAEHPDIHFSISHSGAVIVYASGTESLGVDVEEMACGDLSEFRGFFRTHEWNHINTSEHPIFEFYRVWTVREAFSKLIGQGLSIFDRNQIDFDYRENAAEFASQRFVFRSFQYDHYVISLCMERLLPHVTLHIISPEEWNALLLDPAL